MTAAQSRIIQLLRDGWTAHDSWVGPFASKGNLLIDLNPRTIRAMLRHRQLIRDGNRIILQTPVHK